MKKLFVLLLAAALVSAAFCTAFLAPLSASAANVPEGARFEVFDLTPVDADKDWYQDGVVVAFPNNSDKEISVASGDYQLRYVFILVFDKDGVCVEVGNNLLSADDERAAEFPQHDVTIPAKGFAIFFYYNANEGPANLALYEYYEALGGTIYSNETGRAASGKNYIAELENNTVTVYFAAADTPAESAPSEAPEESSEASSEEPSETPEESSEAPAVSDTPSENASSAETPEPSSEAPAASDATSSQAEESSAGTGVIIGIIIAVVAVVAVAVIVLVVRKKS